MAESGDDARAGDRPELTAEQERAVRLFMDGAPAAAIANALGWSAAAVDSWMRDPEFGIALEETRRRARIAALDRLERLCELAVDALEQNLRRTDDESLRLSAARDVLTWVGAVAELRERRSAAAAGDVHISPAVDASLERTVRSYGFGAKLRRTTSLVAIGGVAVLAGIIYLSMSGGTSGAPQSGSEHGQVVQRSSQPPAQPVRPVARPVLAAPVAATAPVIAPARDANADMTAPELRTTPVTAPRHTPAPVRASKRPAPVPKSAALPLDAMASSARQPARSRGRGRLGITISDSEF